MSEIKRPEQQTDAPKETNITKELEGQKKEQNDRNNSLDNLDTFDDNRSGLSDVKTSDSSKTDKVKDEKQLSLDNLDDVRLNDDSEKSRNEGKEKFKYEHDPTENPKVLKDAMPDSNAVYGFKPNSEGSLKQYANYDWSDSEFVNSAKSRREIYHEKNSEIQKTVKDMAEQGYSKEEIARYANNKRNENRLNDYVNKPPEQLESVKQRNLEKYGNENGMTAEQAYEKYGSWDVVIEKSVDSNPAMDACCGLYDKYYDSYL